MYPFGLGLDLGATNIVASSMEDGKLSVYGRLPSGKHGSKPQVIANNLLNILSVSKFFLSPYQKQDKAKSLVVAIPETWYQNADCPERISLESLLENISAELDHRSVVSQAIAAASYWLIKKQKSEYEGNLLICDMGGFTFDVHLCRISQNKRIKVLYSVHNEVAGSVFDAQCVQLAYTQKHGRSVSEDDPEWGHLLEYFEVEKIKSHVRSSQRLLTYLKAQALMAEYDLYCFGGGYAVNCQQVCEAFAPVERGIQEIIQKLQTWMHDNQQGFDKVILIGGFCEFSLVQRAIQQALRLHNDDPLWSDCLDESEKLLAITYGACLIANYQIEPVEKFPYTLGILCERLNVYAEREQQSISLIPAGTPLDQLGTPRFMTTARLSTFQDYLSAITLWIDSPQKRVLKEVKLPSIPLDNFHGNNTWQIGIQISDSKKLQLVIQGHQLSQVTHYELGSLSEIVSSVMVN